MYGRTSNVTNRGKQSTSGGQNTAGVSDGNADGDKDEVTLEISLYMTIAVALVIVGLGAGMAYLFFRIFYPGCMVPISSPNVRRMLREGVPKRLDGWWGNYFTEVTSRVVDKNSQ